MSQPGAGRRRRGSKFRIERGISFVYNPATLQAGPWDVYSNVMALAPNGTTVYIVGTYSGSLQTLTFNPTNGTLAYLNNCDNPSLAGYNTQWYYPGNVALAGTSGTGTALFVAEGGFGANGNNSYIGVLSASTTGCLKYVKQGTDPNSQWLESIASYPGDPY